MLGLGYASVPLYRLFCAVTGYGGTTMRASDAAVPGAVAGKTMMVRFDANHSSSLPWSFKAEVQSQTVTIGARNIAFFTATNLSDKPVTGTATYNVTPTQSGAHFCEDSVLLLQPPDAGAGSDDAHARHLLCPAINPRR